jgi:uncharacterized delta-60 repeat protein
MRQRTLSHMNRNLLLAVFAIVLTSASTTFAQVDLSSAPSFIKTGTVTALEAQPDGKIIVAGDFSRAGSITRQRLIRLNTDGSVDTSFDPGLGPNGIVLDVEVAADGKILIVGDFSQVGLTPKKYIARLNADGSIDITFNAGGTGPSSTVHKLVKRPGGGYLLLGFMSQYNTTDVTYIAAINDDGTPVPGFNRYAGFVLNGAGSTTGGGCTANQFIAVQPDGKILYANCSGVQLARLNVDGTLDNTFALPADIVPSDVDILPLANGKIIIVGTFSNFEGTLSASRVVRLNADGSKDGTFAVSSVASVKMPAVAANDKFTAVVSVGGNWVNRRFNTAGTVDGTFTETFLMSTALGLTINAFAVQPTGEIFVGGQTTATGEKPLVKVNVNGTPSATVLPFLGTAADVYDAVTDANGNILVYGNFETVNNQPKKSIARLLPSGALDPSFTAVPAIKAMGNFTYKPTIRLQSTGKILVMGFEFSIPAVGTRTGVIRLNSDGSYDNTFATTVTLNSPSFTVLHVLSDNRILFGGRFESSSLTSGNLAILSPNGATDPSFNLSPTLSDFLPTASLVYGNDKIIVGGRVSHNSSGSSASKLIVLNLDGTRDETFNWDTYNIPLMKVNFTPNGIIPFSKGFLITGSPTSSYHPGSEDLITAIDLTGKPITDFRATGRSIITTLAAYESPSGMIVYGGNSYSLAENVLRIANPNGTPAAFSPIAVEGNIAKLIKVSQNKLLVLGSIKVVNNAPAAGSFFYTLNAPASNTIQTLTGEGIDPNTIKLTWTDAPPSQSFEIFRQNIVGGEFAKVGTTSAPTFTDLYATPGALNVYKIRPVNVNGPGEFSSLVSVQTTASTVATPMLTAVVPLHFGKVQLNFTSTVSPSYLVEIERVENPEDLTTPQRHIISVSNNSPLILSGLPPSKEYYYRIRIRQNSSYSEFSSFVKVTTLPQAQNPPFAFEVSRHGNSALLHWTDTVSATLGFEVWKADNGYLEKFVTVQDTFYIHKDLTFGQQTTYAVRSFASDGGYAYYSPFTPLRDLFIPPINSGSWTARASVPATRMDGVGFSIGDFGYVGLGYNGAYLKDFYKYNPVTNGWASIATFPGVIRSDAVAFVIDGKAYVGGGHTTAGAALKDFYRYDPIANTWTPMADFPNDEAGNPGLFEGTGFAANGFGFVTLITREGGIITRELWRYNPATNSWTAKENVPGSVQQEGVIVQANGKVYAGMGGVLGLSLKWYEYTVESNTWVEKTEIPSSYARKGAVAFNHGGVAYVMTGNSSSTSTPSYQNGSERFLSDFGQGMWSSGGLGNISTSRSNAVAFVIHDRVYIATGYNGAYLADLFEYKPSESPGVGLVSDLKATTTSTTTADLTWTYGAQFVTTFDIELSTDGITYSPVHSVSAQVKIQTLTGLSPATKYFVRIRGKALGEYGPYVTTTFHSTPLPAPPSALVVAAHSSSAMLLTWTDNASNETGVEVWRTEISGANVLYAKVATAPANSTTFTDTGLRQDTRYYYYIRAVNDGGVSDKIMGDAKTLIFVPSVPTDLQLVSRTSTQLTFSWKNAAGENITSTDIAYSKETTAAFFNKNVSGSPGTVTGLLPNTKYQIKIRNLYNSTASAYTAVQEFTTLEAVPVAPTNLAATVVTDTQVKLTWNYVAPTTEDGFIIERALLDPLPNFVAIDTVAIGVRLYQDNTVQTLSTYLYRLRAFSTGGKSETALEVQVWVKAIPQMPVLTAVRDSLTRILLTWAPIDNNEDGFEVQSYNFTAGEFETLVNLPANTNSFLHANLLETKNYRYRVRAYNVAGEAISIAKDIMNIVVGLEGDPAYEVVVYPNPGNGKFNVKIPAKGSYSLLNAMGREFITGVLETEGVLDITHLPDGLYLLKLRIKENVVTKKIWKGKNRN